MASTILELAASMVRIFGQMGSRRLLAPAAAAVAVLCADATPAPADLLLYRCGTDVCRVAPDGTGKRRLTDAGTHTWLSASADGRRLAVVRDTFAHVLDGRGRQVAGADGADRDVVARAVADTGWFGPRLTRSDNGDDPPFPLTVCLLAVNTEFPCERDVARDPAQDVFAPAFSPDGTLVAVVQAPGEDDGAGPIVLYDAATAAAVRVLTGGPDEHPSWSPDGKRIAFERDGRLFVARATGRPRERRIGRGEQPVWTTAPACRARPRLRVRGSKVIVTACAPQPGRVTITLRADGRRVARRTVRAATGGTVEARLRRPADRSARLHVAATLR